MTVSVYSLNVRSIRCRIVSGIKDARRRKQSAATHNNERAMTATSWEKAVEDDLKEVLLCVCKL